MSNGTSTVLPAITIPSLTGDTLNYNAYVVSSGLPLRLLFVAFRYREMQYSSEMEGRTNDFYAVAYIPVIVTHPSQPSIHIRSYVAVNCLVHPEDNSHLLFEQLLGNSRVLPEPYKSKVCVCNYADFSFYGTPHVTLVEPYLAFDHRSTVRTSRQDDCKNVRKILTTDRTFNPVLLSTLLEPVKVALSDGRSPFTITLNPIAHHSFTPTPPAPLEAISNDEEVIDEN